MGAMEHSWKAMGSVLKGPAKLHVRRRIASAVLRETPKGTFGCLKKTDSSWGRR